MSYNIQATLYLTPFCDISKQYCVLTVYRIWYCYLPRVLQVLTNYEVSSDNKYGLSVCWLDVIF